VVAKRKKKASARKRNRTKRVNRRDSPLDIVPRRTKDPWNPMSRKVAMAKVKLVSGLSQAKVARLVGLDPGTVSRIAKGHYDPMIPPGLIEQFQAAESSKLTMAVAMCVDEILENPAKVAAASLQQLGTTAAILIDKRELLDGRPTARTEYLFKMGDEEIDGEMLKAYHELRQRLAGKGAIDVTDAVDGELVPAQAEA